MPTNKTGILLTNIGTPDEPSPKAVRRYLKSFLSDRRVVELPRIIWLPILYGFILPFRSIASAKLYQKIWRPDGSPLMHFSKKIAEKMQREINMPVEVGMHYGNPSIEQALNNLREKNVDQIIVLPLYPQYSATTTASSFDLIANVFKTWRALPEFHFISHYYDDENYLQSISSSIQAHWEKQGKAQHLLFSFHGIPKKYATAGDPYPDQCHKTAQLVATHLGMKSDDWSVAFQSRLGRAEWLTPYTDNVLAMLPQKGIKHLQVISPGFAVDCLETLEEIAIRGEEQFHKGGGEKFEYISALNDADVHIQMLINILKNKGK